MKAGCAIAILLTASACAQPPVIVTSSDSGDRDISMFENEPNDHRLFRVISLHEAQSGNDPLRPAMYDVKVEIEDQKGKSLNLLLSSYDPVYWVLSGPGTAAVTGVMVIGNRRAEVSGIEPSRVVNRSSQGANLNAGSTEFAQSVRLIRYAGEHFEDRVDSYIGIYNANGFRIR